MASVFTHNGKFTVKSPREHRVFEVKTQSEKSKFAPGKRVISVRETQEDGRWKNRSFGFVFQNAKDPRSGVVAVWRNFKSGEEGKPSIYEKYAQLFMKQEFYEKRHNFEFLVEGRCRVCNRELTDPESIKNGVGPTCLKNIGG